MKIPWTPGPWTLRLEPIDVNWWDNVERMANITLASKSPEMAELLIEANSGKGIIWERWAEKAFLLLKEIGFNPEPPREEL